MQPEQKIQTARYALSHEGALANFMSKVQRAALAVLLSSEEGEAIADTIIEYAKRIVDMPQTYQTDGQGWDAVAHLHYFHGGHDWYITEKDKGTGDPNDTQQIQAYGLADMGCPEIGYIPIQTLIENNIELDLYWTPKPLKECK